MLKNLTICVLGIIILNACTAKDNKPLNITTTPTTYSKPIIPKVDNLALKEVSWVVLTENNYASIFARLRDEGKEPILYALTSDGYVAFIHNNTDILKLVRQQKKVIAAYDNWQYWEK